MKRPCVRLKVFARTSSRREPSARPAKQRSRRGGGTRGGSRTSGRLRARGSSGGQRGPADVLAALAREVVPRLRIGVGRSAEPARDTQDYVLDTFSAEAGALLPALIARAGDALQRVHKL
jgi:hypothetical protein